MGGADEPSGQEAQLRRGPQAAGAAAEEPRLVGIGPRGASVRHPSPRSTRMTRPHQIGHYERMPTSAAVPLVSLR